MRNLLTNKTKQNLKSEYRLRLFAVLFMFVSGLLIIGDVFLLPSLLLSKAQKSSTEDRVHLVEQGLALREADLSSETVQLVTSKLDVLSSLRDKKQFSESLREIIENKPSGISIETFFYTQKNGNEGALTLSGVARTRKDLSSFENILKNHPEFTDVLLPVSNLAKDKDISFSVIIKGTI